MAIDLKKTDVVIVGLGAAGGVAALPLARAGVDVIGLEAGSWLTARDFAPDELRNNFRGWPQSAQKANGEIPTHRPDASAPYSPRLPIHPMMNAGWLSLRPSAPLIRSWLQALVVAARARFHRGDSRRPLPSRLCHDPHVGARQLSPGGAFRDLNVHKFKAIA
jgi:choline dehydrogenase-like flavoprotein